MAARHAPVLLCALICLQLAAVSIASAAVFTVGPGGVYPSIQAAIDAAVADGGDHEVRIAQGTYRENIKVIFHPHRLEVSGGWEAGFTRRVLDWELTTILAELGDDGVVVECDGGQVELRNLKITRDAVAPIGRGVRVNLLDSCRVSIVGSRITGHHAMPVTEPDRVVGAGIWVENDFGDALARFVLKDSSVDNNRLGDQRYAHGVACGEGGGFSMFAISVDEVTITGNTFAGNVLDPRTPEFANCVGAGLLLQLDFVGNAEVSDNVIRNNRSLSVDVPGDHLVTFNRSVGMWLSASGDAVLTARRNRVVGNTSDPLTGATQAEVQASRGGRLLFTDSLVAGGSVDGVAALASADSSAILTNLTIVDNDGLALRTNVRPGLPSVDEGVTISNSISFSNGDDTLAFSPGIDVAPSNWIGLDPSFMNAAGGDYRLRAGSPAVDTGDNSPVGGLGPRDLDRGDRLVGAQVDVGAFEYQSAALSCRVRDLAIPEVPHFVSACRCFEEPLGLFTRCTFALPDWVMIQRIPRFILPGQSFGIDYRFLAAQRTAIGLRVSQLIDGKQQPLEQGTAQNRLQPDELWTPAVSGTSPAAAGLYPLQTHITYQLPDVQDENGAPFRGRVVLEVFAATTGLQEQ